MKEFEANTKRMIKEKKEAQAQWLYDNRPYSPPPYEFEVPDMSEQPMPAISVIPPDARKIKSLDEAQKEKRLKAILNDPAVKKFEQELNIDEKIKVHFENLDGPLAIIRDKEIRKADLGEKSEVSCDSND